MPHIQRIVSKRQPYFSVTSCPLHYPICPKFMQWGISILPVKFVPSSSVTPHYLQKNVPSSCYVMTPYYLKILSQVP
nr:MAG TPA: hypothetical protein [Caudoviricetes sp.]